MYCNETQICLFLGISTPAMRGTEFPPWWAINYPCLCLCLGLTQIILTTPRRFTILHLSHLTLTEALTFMTSPHYLNR